MNQWLRRRQSRCPKRIRILITITKMVTLSYQVNTYDYEITFIHFTMIQTKMGICMPTTENFKIWFQGKRSEYNPQIVRKITFKAFEACIFLSLASRAASFAALIACSRWAFLNSGFWLRFARIASSGTLPTARDATCTTRRVLFFCVPSSPWTPLIYQMFLNKKKKYWQWTNSLQIIFWNLRKILRVFRENY